jgi:hypothetical protein
VHHEIGHLAGEMDREFGADGLHSDVSRVLMAIGKDFMSAMAWNSPSSRFRSDYL